MTSTFAPPVTFVSSGEHPRNTTGPRRNHFPLLAKASRNPPWLLIPPTKRGPKALGHMGTVMIKALSAVAVAAFVAAALTVLPGFAPQVEASTPQALAKGDRLDIHAIGRH